MPDAPVVSRLGTVISDDGRYRYRLTRLLPAALDAPAQTRILFVMLNPSTADEQLDDATIRRCRYHAARLGGTELAVVNLYAHRATEPRELLTAVDPVGPDNDRWIAEESRLADHVIAAWGADPAATPTRIRRVLELLASGPVVRPLLCLGTTVSGAPRHPGRLANETPFELWEPPGA